MALLREGQAVRIADPAASRAHSQTRCAGHRAVGQAELTLWTRYSRFSWATKLLSRTDRRSRPPRPPCACSLRCPGCSRARRYGRAPCPGQCTPWTCSTSADLPYRSTQTRERRCSEARHQHTCRRLGAASSPQRTGQRLDQPEMEVTKRSPAVNGSDKRKPDPLRHVGVDSITEGTIWRLVISLESF